MERMKLKIVAVRQGLLAARPRTIAPPAGERKRYGEPASWRVAPDESLRRSRRACDRARLRVERRTFARREHAWSHRSRLPMRASKRGQPRTTRAVVTRRAVELA
jgi:hypothetical protein